MYERLRSLVRADVINVRKLSDDSLELMGRPAIVDGDPVAR
jgi:hypothetical protein